MTADQARVLRDWMVGIIETEAKGTRRVVAAIPNDKRHHKHDPKSRTAWELATHLVISDIWFADSIASGAFVWACEPSTPPEMTDPDAVAKWHEKHLDERLVRLRAMSDDELLRDVDFFGTKAPAVMWLGIMNNHSVHHRGQLGTYLRPMGSKMPAVYGMSADENMMAG